MLKEYIALFPEFLLFLGIIFMSCVRIFRRSNTPKTFYTISNFFIICAAVFSAIFYNQNVSGYLHNNNFTSLFKAFTYLFVLIWNYLSVKRFLSKNTPSFAFYSIVMFNLSCLLLAISSLNLWILFFSLSASFLCNYPLILIEEKSSEKIISFRFFLFSLLFVGAFAIGILIFNQYTNNLAYSNISDMLEQQKIPLPISYIAISLIFAFMLFIIGIAPFHFWFSEAVEVSILPVAGYLTIIPIFTYFACFINVSANVFAPYMAYYYKIFYIFGILSVFAGAIGANSEENMRKIFAYSGLYYIGFIILGLFPLSEQSLVSSFIYLLIYITAFCGIYTVFCGYRSKGRYLSCLEDIKGVSSQRPYISAALLLFMISLIGTPPMLGFLGKLSIINTMVIEHKYTIIGVVLLGLLILVYAYLKIITAVYFEGRNNNFDIVDKGVYLCVLFNLLFMLIVIINPKPLMQEIENTLIMVLQ